MNNKWKRILACLLATIFILSSVGCGKKDDNENAANADVSGTVAVTTDTKQEEKEEEAVPALQEVVQTASGMPTLTAQSAILVNADTGTILAEKNATAKMYPASMTKILTALILLDNFSPDELVTVGTEINEVSLDSSKAGHVVGETLTVKNLLRGLLIPSGNDSANVIAALVAKKVEGNDSLSFSACEEKFAELMNEKAKSLGAVNSHFTNAHGYHDENHYTTAYDMALITMAALQNDTILEIAEETSFSGNGADGLLDNTEGAITQDYNWVSHNLLITNNEYRYDYAIGVKTGFTDEAGDCVAAAAEKDGERLVAVIFNSPDPARWTDATALFEYGYNAYTMATVASTETALDNAALYKHNRLQGDTVPVVVQEDLKICLPTDYTSEATWTITYDSTLTHENKDGSISLQAPLEAGQKVGEAVFTMDGKEVATASVYAGNAVEKSTVWSTIRYYVGAFFRNLFTLRTLIILIIIIIIILLFFFIRRMRNRRGYGYGGGYRTRSRSNYKIGGRRRRF